MTIPPIKPPNQARLPAQDIPSEAEYDLLHLNAVLNWTKGVCSNGTSCGGPFNLYGSTFQARYTPPQVKVQRAALVLQHWWPCSHACEDLLVAQIVHPCLHVMLSQCGCS